MAQQKGSLIRSRLNEPHQLCRERKRLGAKLEVVVVGHLRKEAVGKRVYETGTQVAVTHPFAEVALEPLPMGP
jgi:hypothetical protein